MDKEGCTDKEGHDMEEEEQEEAGHEDFDKGEHHGYLRHEGGRGGHCDHPKHRMFFAFGGLMPLTLLKMLKEKPAHGYQLKEELEKKLGKQIPAGIVYGLLRRLEHKGYLTSKWDVDQSGPARRVYYLTDEGLAVFNERLEHYRSLKSALDELFK